MMGMAQGGSLFAVPIGQEVGRLLFNGTPFFQDDRGGFCTKFGAKVKQINDKWCFERHCIKGSENDKWRWIGPGQSETGPTLRFWFYHEPPGEPAFFDDQDRQLPVVGYERKDWANGTIVYSPVYFHKDSGLYIVWASNMITREKLGNLIQPAGRLSNGRPFFKHDLEGFRGVDGGDSREIRRTACRKMYFKHVQSDEITLWVAVGVPFLHFFVFDEQNRPLKRIGYFHKNKEKPVHFHEASGMCIVWPDRIATGKELAGHVNLIVGRATEGGSRFYDVFEDDELGKFCTTNGKKAKKINDVWCVENVFQGTAGKMSFWADIDLKLTRDTILFDDQDRPLPIVGYERKSISRGDYYSNAYYSPVYLYNGKYITSWSNGTVTRKELGDRLIQPAGYFSNGNPFFKDDLGGFLAKNGGNSKTINRRACKDMHFMHKQSGEIILWVGEAESIIFQHDRYEAPLPIVGFHRETKIPIFFHKTSGLYLVWPEKIATREELGDHLIQPAEAFFNGFRFFKDDLGEFCAVDGGNTREIKGKECKRMYFTHEGFGEITLWVCQTEPIIFKHDSWSGDTPLTFAGYHRETRAPIFRYAWNLYIAWPDRIVTGEELEIPHIRCGN
jgi:hypothetical protein